ncbi:translation initiation factor IF-2-like [Panthera leo]|uniref:translation initiation factor IF-2-like n=1 Tax=Panthera leo TaxID=9689 RepID=UPI001C69A8E3|nr:translation initiation factor IF-2-like [Panthera leo]
MAARAAAPGAARAPSTPRAARSGWRAGGRPASRASASRGSAPAAPPPARASQSARGGGRGPAARPAAEAASAGGAREGRRGRGPAADGGGAAPGGRAPGSPRVAGGRLARQPEGIPAPPGTPGSKSNFKAGPAVTTWKPILRCLRIKGHCLLGGRPQEAGTCMCSGEPAFTKQMRTAQWMIQWWSNETEERYG